MDWFDSLLWPLKVAVAWTMVQFHNLFTGVFGLAEDSGASWALSIVGLVILMRIILIPLFFKQIKASRGMQMLSPELQAIQKKYKGKSDPASREAMGRETMELYRKHGTSPFSSCLPILAQSPVFFALFRVLYSLPQVASGSYPRGNGAIGPIDSAVAQQISDATIFGAKISSHFLAPDATTSTRIVTAILIVAMSATTFFTQRQLTRKNMPPSALQGPMAQQQKVLLYALPLIFAFTGVNFPIGVLIYWTTTNLWSMGQQFYTIRRMPMPGSEAETAFKERQARKAARRGGLLSNQPETSTEIESVIEEPKSGQRQQPKRQSRQKRTQQPKKPDQTPPVNEE
ncbi:MAG: membrane protein insertase YidC [Actinomycetota bacterium]|nr:membrane protein insertase YidC [Actinomycetota bacterium]